MNKPANRIALITLAVVIICFCIYLALTKTSQIIQQKQNHQLYIASQPSYGPLVKTLVLSVSFQDNIAVGELAHNKANAIAIGQDTILYDKNGFPLPLGGKVYEIENQEGRKRIFISLPDQTNTSFLSPKVDLITLETTASKRLPHSAVVHNNNEESFVWRATPTEDNEKQYDLSKLPIKVGLTDPNFFEEAGFKIKSDDIVIINPDKFIQENTPYDIKLQELEAYMHNPTKQAWIDFEIDKMHEQQARLIERAENCGKLTAGGNIESSNQSTITNGNNTSCGVPNYEGADPFLVFQNLIHELQNKESDMP